MRGAADSTRIWIGGHPHDPRYALFVMPGQALAIEAHIVGGLAQRWDGDGTFETLPAAPGFAKAAMTKGAIPRPGVRAPGRTLVWRAPELAGAAFLTLKTATPAEPGSPAAWKDVARLNIMVMMPAEQMIAGRINGYLIGNYPTPRTQEDSTYLPPMAFLKSTGQPTPLSPNFFLEDFACHQEHEGERFVALQPRLLPFLEAISARVQEITGARPAYAAHATSASNGRQASNGKPGTAEAVDAKSAAAAGGLAASLAQAHDIDSDDDGDSALESSGKPHRPNLPNRPAAPPAFRSSVRDAMAAAIPKNRAPVDMAEVVRERPIKVLSGYRTPAYNRGLGTAKLSRHQYGDACDIYVDRDNDGRMDDLNLDGSVDGRDAITLASWIEELWQNPEFRECPGGLGIYNGTGAHGPFVHVDLRGFKARWGGNGLRWDDENESARELLGQAYPLGDGTMLAAAAHDHHATSDGADFEPAR